MTVSGALILDFRGRMARLEFLVAKEYAAEWLKPGQKVSRDPGSGKFSSKTSSATDADAAASDSTNQTAAALLTGIQSDVDTVVSKLPKTALKQSSADINAFTQQQLPWADAKLSQVRDRLNHLDQEMVDPGDFTKAEKDGIQKTGQALAGGFDWFRNETQGKGKTLGERLQSFKDATAQFAADHIGPPDGRLVGLGIAYGAEFAILTSYVQEKGLVNDGEHLLQAGLRTFLKYNNLLLRNAFVKELAAQGGESVVGRMKPVAFLAAIATLEAETWATDSFHRWQVDHNLPDAKHIPDDERKARRNIKAQLEKLKAPNTEKIAVVRPQIIGGHSTSLEGQKPRPMYEVEYEGVKYAAPSKDDLLESASYYSARIKRFPDRLKNAIPSVTLSGHFWPGWITNLIPNFAESIEHGGFPAGLLKGRVLAYTEGDNRAITMIADNSGRPHEGIETLVHESGHALASTLYGPSTDPRDNGKGKIEYSWQGDAKTKSDYGKIISDPRTQFSAVSNYANAAPAEDFAEATRLYFQNPKQLKKLEPERYQVIHRLMTDPQYKG